MPKTKNKKAIVKRVKITSSGKIMRRNQLMNHLKNSKSAARVRRQQEPKQLDGVDLKRVKHLLPYS